MKQGRPYLLHVADSIEAIETFVLPGREEFLGNRMMQDAVIRNFEIIGEAAGQLGKLGIVDPSLTRAVAFRNRLIHGYWSVDLLVVWDVVVNDLPVLKASISRLLEKLPGD